MVLARLVSADDAGALEQVGRRAGLDAAGLQALLGQAARLVLWTGLQASDRECLKAQAGPASRCVVGDWGRRPGTLLLQTTAAELARLREALPGPLAEALQGLARSVVPPATLELAGRRFAWGERTWIMGVVNVTPDSFSDGGSCLGLELALAHGRRLVEAGAQFLDVGGESTRPGAERVSEAEELRRVLPVIEGLAAQCPGVPISVDTSKAVVARRAIAMGASLINDVAGLRDPGMAQVAVDTGAALCVMHMQGEPRTMQQNPTYDDVVAEVIVSLAEGVERAVAAGVRRERVLVDPGFGFGKTLGHNLFLLRRLRDLRVLGQPILVGTSRKAMLGALIGGRPPAERVAASAASAAVMAVLEGADVVRVHDVAETRDALAVADAVRKAHDGGAAWAAGV